MKIKTSLREVDCSKYEPIVKHPLVIKLNNISQLSFVDKVYRGGTHTRLDHSIFVHHFTEEITNHLLGKKCINQDEKRNLEIAAILHDIGHPPFSHATEFVLQALQGNDSDHKKRAVELIESNIKDKEGRTLKECIEFCGGDVKTVEDIILKKHPLHKIISHNTLGSDKTGYTLLDSNRTFYSYQFPFFLDIFPSYYYSNGILGLEDNEKVPQVKNIQSAYLDMYLNVYFHSIVRYYVRLFQKGIQTILENGDLSTEELWNIEEFEIKTILKKNKKTEEIFMKIQNEDLEEILFSIGRKEDKFKDVLPFYTNPLNLSIAEREISKEFDFDESRVICTLSIIPGRAIPEDVYIFSDKKTIFEKYPTHHANLIETEKSYTFINLYGPNTLPKERCKKIILDEVPRCYG